MQAVLSISTAPLLPLTPPKIFSPLLASPAISFGSVSRRQCPIKASAVAYDASVVDYSSALSVFPAEACETIGGEACSAIIFPEVRLQPADSGRIAIAVEEIDREYLEYGDAKTVFLGEACDDLGGEFCGIEFQTGIY